MEPFPAPTAPARSTRELTLAEILDPATFTRSRRRFKAIRDCAVYVLHAGAPRAFVALDRSYRPLGGVRVAPGVRVDYSLFPHHRFARAELNLGAGPGDGSTWLSSPAHAEGRSFWLWTGSTAPYVSAANLARYRLALLDVFGREGLARLAALAGRELGDYPDRPACEAALRRYADLDACVRPPECAPVPCRAPQSVRGRPDGRAEVRCSKQDAEQAICATAVGSAQARPRTPSADGEPALAPLERGSAVSEIRTQIRVWVPSALAARLYRRAGEARTSVRQVVLDALDQHLGGEAPPAEAATTSGVKYRDDNEGAES